MLELVKTKSRRANGDWLVQRVTNLASPNTTARARLFRLPAGEQGAALKFGDIPKESMAKLTAAEVEELRVLMKSRDVQVVLETLGIARGKLDMAGQVHGGGGLAGALGQLDQVVEMVRQEGV